MGAWTFILLVTFYGLVSAAQASLREEASSWLERQRDEKRVVSRMAAYSSSFLGLPYGSSGPLGEGDQGRYDQDPLYRFDTFDCTTFVETVVSLALSPNVDAFEQGMNRIRYAQGEVDFLTRNHFPSLQWIPNNLANGTFFEVNEQVIPDEEQSVAEAEIDIAGWLRKSGPRLIQIPGISTIERTERGLELQRRADRYFPVLARLKYISIARLLREPALLRKIPDGAVINFVRPNWDLTDSLGTRMNVSHQGLVFQSVRGPILRHASVSGEKKVIESGLLSYLKTFEDHPTLKGIHLLKVTRPEL
jgi:hypothetical protein